MLSSSSLFSWLKVTVMAAKAAILIGFRSSCDLISMCVILFLQGLATPEPLICEPSVYTKSWGLHFRLWGLVSCMFAAVCGFIGVSVYV